MTYDELIKDLRFCVEEGSCRKCRFDNDMNCSDTLMAKAADAIDELQVVVDGLTAQTIMVFEKTEGRTVIKFEPKWIPVTERLPEESEGLNWHEDVMIRFTSVWCCEVNTGRIEVRNRLQGKMTGNKYLDLYTKDTDWHWSKSGWEPTHWMPIVPLPEPPKDGE